MSSIPCWFEGEVLLKTLYAASTAFSLPVLAESDQTFSIHAQQLIPNCQLAILEEESRENLAVLISELLF